MAEGKFPSDRLNQYMVRFPPGMRNWLKAAAEMQSRSMNAEIIARLEESINEWPERAEQYAEGQKTAKAELERMNLTNAYLIEQVQDLKARLARAEERIEVKLDSVLAWLEGK